LSAIRSNVELSGGTGARSASRRIAIAAAVVALGTAGSMVAAGRAEAELNTSGCPPLTASYCHSYGSSGTTPIYFSSAGADLTAYCLGFSEGLKDDFVNYQTRVYTNGGIASGTWVEEGIRNGSVYDINDNPITTGIQWFWAEAMPSGYLEHFITYGTIGSTRNVAFYYAGSGDWDIYHAGVYIGTSAVGAYANVVETGMESTTYMGRVAGISRNFNYGDGLGHTTYITPVGDQDSGTWLYLAKGYVNAGMGSCPNTPAASAAAAPTTARPMTATTYRQTLSDITRAWASASGEPKPSRTSFIKTTRQQANRAMGSKIADDADVYLIQVSGKFVAHQAKVPSRDALPTGSSMILTVDASTGQVLDWGVTTSPRDISSLGSASSL
jgi:hypothetical protein